MRTHVTFQADFSKDAGPSEPAGRELAQSLASYLAGAGYASGPPQPHEGYAFTFDCQREKHVFTVFVGLVDDGELEWLVFVVPYIGSVARLLQKVRGSRAKNPDSPQLHALCTTIHQYLRENQRFRSVRWYTTEGWDTNPDADWTRSP